MYCARDLACAVLFSKNLHHSTVVFFDKKNPFLEVFFHTTVVIEVFYHTTVVFFFFAKRQIGTQRRAGDWPRLSIHVRGTFLKKKTWYSKESWRFCWRLASSITPRSWYWAWYREHINKKRRRLYLAEIVLVKFVQFRGIENTLMSGDVGCTWRRLYW